MLNVALAGPLRPRKIRADKPGWRQMRREIMVSLRTVLIFALVGMVISFAALSGKLAIYTEVATFGWTWFWISTALIVVTHDARFYWAQWLMHKPRLYRLLHRTHHKSHNPTPFASYAFDPGEAVVHAAFLPLFVAIEPMHPGPLMIFLVHMMARNAEGHCGIEVFPARCNGRPRIDWMSSVTHHDIHHSNARFNLGLSFTWWDRMMGTEHPDYHETFAQVVKRRKSGSDQGGASIFLDPDQIPPLKFPHRPL